jgi:hypothetical protein
MNGDDIAILKNADLVGRAVHFHCPPACAVRYAVEIAVDGNHAVTGNASLEPQHGLERACCQRLQRRTLLGEMLGHNAPGRRMGARIGNLVEPLAELLIEIVEVAEAPAEEEVLADVAERTLDLALCLGPIRLARLWQVAVVAGEREQRAIVDDVAGLGILAVEHRSHAVIEDLLGHASERLECRCVTAQQRLQILMQHEAAPEHAAVAQHHREQPDDPLDAGLIGEDRSEMREIHLRLAAGRGLEADLER